MNTQDAAFSGLDINGDEGLRDDERVSLGVHGTPKLSLRERLRSRPLRLSIGVACFVAAALLSWFAMH